MTFTALTLVCLSLHQAPEVPLPNVDFRQGTLKGWLGQGFTLTPGAAPTVSSTDAGNPRRKGMLRYVFQVPPGAGTISFECHAVLAPGCAANGRLDVLLLGAGNRVVPREVRTGSAWGAAPSLLTTADGRPCSYRWDVSAHVGKTLQIALVDEDDRPGCHLVAGGFRLEPAGDGEWREFGNFMQGLVRDHKLPRAARYESKHFTAWSNADAEFTATRLRNCEVMYDNFLAHFRRKGFTVRTPAARLMVALFDSQGGFEAYLGQKMPPTLVGLYHPGTNRLIVYDLDRNRGVQAGKEHALKVSQQIPFDIDRVQFVGAAERHARDFVRDANIGTTMHEVAHQMSFNCGLLSRTGDVPVWLAEGLACYCEPAEKGAWQGIGAPNPERVRALTAALRGPGRLLSVSRLAGGDDWRRDGASVMAGYAQSWALFRMLMEERPQALKAYLALIAGRRAPEHRLTDFRQAFGADLAPLERRHFEYVQRMVEQYGPRR